MEQETLNNVVKSKVLIIINIIICHYEDDKFLLNHAENLDERLNRVLEVNVIYILLSLHNWFIMKRKQLTVILLGLIIILATLTPVQGTVKSTYIKKLPYKFKAKPPWAGKPDKSKTSVNILNIPNGETVMGSVTVIVEAKGDFNSIELQGIPMSPVGYGNRYYATWTAPSSGSASILVEGKDVDGRTVASDTVAVTAVSEPLWEVYIEVDYIQGHYPNTVVLDYLVSYWSGFAIDVEYLIDDEIPLDNSVTSAEFLELEKAYNGAYWFDDQAQDGYDADGDGYDGEYLSKEKWMLWGTWDENANVCGYTHVVINKKDALAGNYIYIADAMIDSWEAANDMYTDNGEVIVACHELGHSIGILQLKGQSEKYDPDHYSIMSTMNTENALYMENNWYYSGSYWGTKNLEYYLR